MSSIADDTVTGLGGRSSVLDRQKRDHIQLDGLLEQVQPTRGDDQDKSLPRIRRLVFRHAYAEETVLWPAMRAVLPDGDPLALRVVGAARRGSGWSRAAAVSASPVLAAIAGRIERPAPVMHGEDSSTHPRRTTVNA